MEITLGDLEYADCDAVDNVDMLPGGPSYYCLEPKWDGYRLIIHRAADSVALYTRTWKDQVGKLPYVEQEIMALFPPHTVIDSEITATIVNMDGSIEGGFDHVQSIMNSKPDRAVSHAEETRRLKLIVFDLMFLGGEDLRSLTLLGRKTRLNEEILNYIQDAAPPQHISVSPSWPAAQVVHDELYGLGYEGSVAKRIDSRYGAKGWYKIKPQREVDVIIIGYKPGEGKYLGKIGSIIFGQPDDKGRMIERGSCSGMFDDVRDYITTERDRLLDTVVTIAHQGTYSRSVRFRHPQFKRFRPDKPVTDVKWHNR